MLRLVRRAHVATTIEMELPVQIPSVATLRLLWLVQISKGLFSLEWPARLEREEAVELALRVGARRIVLPATVRSCAPANQRFHVSLILAPLSDVLRHELEAALAMEESVRY